MISDQKALQMIARYDRAEAAHYCARGRAHGNLSAVDLEDRLTDELRSLVAAGRRGVWQPVLDVLCDFKLRGLLPPHGEACHLFFRAARTHLPQAFSDPAPLNG